MADVFLSQTRHLRAASFDFDSKSIFLNVFSKSKFQTPILAEDGIPFLEKWYRKPIALPLTLFAPVTSQFPESAQKTLIDNFCQTLHAVENGTGSQNLFLSIGLLRSQTTAPLLFVPLKMDVQSRTVSLQSAPPVENVALRIRHKDAIDLPPAKIFQDGSTFQIKKYFLAVERAVDAVAGWQSTSRGIFLGFFDAASLYAHQDLESASRSETFEKNSPARELLSDEGLRVIESNLDEKEPDEIFDPTKHYFVRTLDFEANTALLETISSENGIEAVETPPGSAREDFLANLISEKVSTGKNVLVAYKRNISRHLLEKILYSEPPGTSDTTLEKARESLTSIRNALVLYNKAANRPIPPGNSTLEESLVALNGAPSKKVWPDSTFCGVENLNRENFRLVQGIVEDILEKRKFPEIKKALGAFNGISITAIDTDTKAELLQELQSANAKYQTLATLAESVSGEFFFDKSIDISALSHLGEAITPEFNSETPSFEGWNLESKDWETYGESLRELPAAGKAWSDFRKNGSSVYISEAIDMPLGASREVLKSNQNRKFKVFSEYYHNAKKALLKTLRNPKAVKSDAELLELTDKLIRLQNCKKIYMNFSVMALRLFGKDWQFEHTDWDLLESKIHWLFEFRKKLSNGEKANLSLAILSKYNSVQNHIPDANALSALCQSAKSEFGEICRKLSFIPAEEFTSVEDQANLIRKWCESFSQLPDYIQINIKRNELKALGLFNLEKALFETGMQKESLATDLSRFWNAAQIQNACKIFPALFSVSPKAHSKYAKDFQAATDDLAAMNLRHFKESLQKTPQLLTILPLDEIAKSPPAKTYDIAICIDAESVTPLQALPVILRSNRTILVGDSCMPTLPFSRLLGNFDRHDFIASQFESFLAYAMSKGAKRSRLSLNILHRHPLLLDFSNSRFYNRKIQTFPSPNPTDSQAIRFAVEKDPAKAIASAVTGHARRHPTQSLGIIVFTEERRQDIAQAIQKELEREPDLEHILFPGNSRRAFYVKRPEEAVGEYRDTIFLCAESDAIVAGQGISSKQVNVCATHALSTLKIFAAETPEKTVSANKGVRTYQEFLLFAFHAEEASIFKSNPVLSPFEELIFNEIRSDEIKMEKNWGYNDFTIPFAVRDGNNPERFLLGIDTDSGNRFLSRSVEDRLYIRPKLFKHLGWKIIHLWSPNWFRSTADERNHVLTTIAVEQSVAPMPSEKKSETPPDIPVRPYEIRNPEKSPANSLPIAETSTDELISQLQFYVNSESPIHEKNLIRRVLHFHGLHRAGPAVVRTLKDAISQGIAQKAFLKTGSFFYSRESGPIVLRDRSTLPDEERSILYVSPEERALFPQGTDDQKIRETLGLN